ncbi:UNVERIFIED_CONTAM: Deoxynucleoside triphosphate triphosphohydrolase SAMHD1 [Sesamum indicum]
MGAFCDGDFTFSSNYSFVCSQDMRSSKNVHDNVHGSIYLDPLCLKFIDTEQFQRLRELKQLGGSSVVIMNAMTRVTNGYYLTLHLTANIEEIEHYGFESHGCHHSVQFRQLQLLRITFNTNFKKPYFWYMRSIIIGSNQWGMAHMVYPGAVHSRFEHSLGVYWLAGEAGHKLKIQQGSELGIDRFDMQTLKLAGLLHDIGHGPFSHLFEREFLPEVLKGSEWSHELMSVEMVDYIVDEHQIDIDAETMKRVKKSLQSLSQKKGFTLNRYEILYWLILMLLSPEEMILASSKYATTRSTREKRFLYDIVANGRNGIDVDKFDYIVRDCRACGLGCNFQFQRLMESMRVMGDEICYRAKDYLTIHKLFATRADLYRTVYTHAKVKAIELMVVDALVSANSYLQIASHIQDPSEYWKLDDTIIKTIETAPDQELKESRDLILRIRRRDLYQFCNEYAVPKDKLENFKKVTARDIVCSQKNGGATLREEDVVVSNVRIDLTRGKHNPLESIKFFKVGVISEAFENFQLKTYGIKAQVHATPEKKKRRM